MQSDVRGVVAGHQAPALQADFGPGVVVEFDPLVGIRRRSAHPGDLADDDVQAGRVRRAGGGLSLQGEQCGSQQGSGEEERCKKVVFLVIRCHFLTLYFPLKVGKR